MLWLLFAKYFILESNVPSSRGAVNPRVAGPGKPCRRPIASLRQAVLPVHHSRRPRRERETS